MTSEKEKHLKHLRKLSHQEILRNFTIFNINDEFDRKKFKLNISDYNTILIRNIEKKKEYIVEFLKK